MYIFIILLFLISRLGCINIKIHFEVKFLTVFRFK